MAELGDKYSDFSGVRVNKTEGVKFLATNTSDPTAEGQMNYVAGTGFRGYGASGVFTFGSGGGGTGGGLESAYSVGGDENTILMDEGAIQWTDATTGALNMHEFIKSGAGSGNMLDLSVDAALTGSAIALDMNLGVAAPAISIDNGATARTGADLAVNDDSTGNHSVIDLNKSGSGASVGLDYQESYNGSSASFVVKATLDNGDGIDTTVLQAVRGTGIRTAPVIDINDASTGSADIIDVDLTGIYTGDVFDFASSAAATGNIFNLNLDNAVAMTALHMEGSGVRTQPFVEMTSDCTGAANFITCSAGGTFTGDVLAIDLDAAVGANAVSLDAGGGTRTAPVMLVTMDGDGASAGATFMDVNVTATGATASGVFDVDVTGVYTGAVFNVGLGAAATGEVMAVDMNLGLAAAFLTLDAGNGTRTVDLIDVTFDGDGNVGYLDLNCTNTGSGNLIDVDVDGIHTGNIVDLTYGTAASTGNALAIAMGTNVAGSAMVLTGAGARADDLIKIDDSSTGSAHIFDINLSGIYTGNCLDVTYSVSAATGNAIDLNMGTNVAGMAIDVGSAATGTSGEGSAVNVSHTGDLGAGADLVRLLSTGSHSSTSNLLAVEATTGASSSGAYAVYINATGANVEGLKVDAGTVTIDETLTVTGGLAGKLIGATITTTSGPDAVAVTGTSHEVTTTGTGDAMTLANGTAGQKLSVVYVAEGAGADTAVITPTTLAGGATITLNALGDSCDLEYHTTGGWYVLGLGGTAAVA